MKEMKSCSAGDPSQKPRWSGCLLIEVEDNGSILKRENKMDAIGTNKIAMVDFSC